MASSTEVIEEPCQVKLVSYDPVVPERPKSQTTNDQETDDGVVEDHCTVKTTHYSKLAAKYWNENAMGLEERRQRLYPAAVAASFYVLRHECLAKRQLFVDSSFPPDNSSITFNSVTRQQYEWKRPFEIVKDPRFFVEGATRFDIQQGELGDCWLLAAIANLTLNSKLFHFVVPCDQSFRYKYAGIFHFRFWQYGKWQDVVIDDLLPTYRGHLVYMHSKTKSEFWCALLEKAYAKMYGCYEALAGGNVGESMVDVTGGVVEIFDLSRPPPNMFTIIKKASRRGSMMGCGIEPDDPNIPMEGRLANGLIARHAYSITKATRVPYYNSEIELLRLHNPWGNEAEWKGAWSDLSREWRSIDAQKRDKLGITFDDDGEFWMPFRDFISNFTTMTICDITPDVFTTASNQSIDCDSDDEECIMRQTMRRSWKIRSLEGEWTPGLTAGGCRNYLDTFDRNPQQIILLDKVDENDGGNCTLVVSLMQKYVRQRKRYGAEFVPIGFVIYRLPPGVIPGRHLDSNFFKYNPSCAKSPFFLNSREVSYHFNLPPGVYVVIPSTFEPECKSQFLLRVFTEHY